jgi:outer membrane protein, heavy metal efflux system
LKLIFADHMITSGRRYVPIGGWRTLALGGLLPGILAGCQSYERRPLDLEETRSAWLSRWAGDDTVRAFRASLGTGSAANHDEIDLSNGLSLGEAEVVALVFNPDLRLARLEADVTRASAAHAGLWDDPTLGMNVERLVSGGAEPWVLGGTLGLTLPVSGRLSAEKARADASHEAGLDRVAALEWATRALVRETWIQWSASRERAAATAELVDRLREVASLAQKQERAGSMSRIDARLVRVELAGRETDLLQESAETASLHARLGEVLGLPPAASGAFVPGVAWTPRSASGEELRAMFEAGSAELAAVRSEYEVSERALRAEVRKQYPDITLSPGFGVDQGEERLLLGVSIPVPLWNRNQQGVAEATARRELARMRFDTTYERLASRAASALARYEAVRARRGMIESTVVPLADEQEADVRKVAALGQVDPFVLLESLKARHLAKVRLIEAIAEESLWAVRLDELVGPVSQAQAEGEVEHAN